MTSRINAVALEICEWISFSRTPIGIGRIDPCEGGVGVGDSDHQLPAPLPGSQDIFQMIEMENLKTAMNDTSLCHNHPDNLIEGPSVCEREKCA